MMRVILLLIILKWPFNPIWLPTILSVGTIWYVPGEYWPCRTEAIACYFSPTESMYVKADPSEWQKVGGGLEGIVFHELQHHLQYKSELGWRRFEEQAENLYLYGDYNDHQRASMRAHAKDSLGELHAQLPTILEGEIPCSLQEWYPWFHCEGTR